MEIYKEIETTASKEFVKLLNSQLSKNKIEEGKIVEGKVAKITEKFVFLFIDFTVQSNVIIFTFDHCRRNKYDLRFAFTKYIFGVCFYFFKLEFSTDIYLRLANLE